MAAANDSLIFQNCSGLLRPDWHPRMGIDPKRASGETRTKVLRVLVAQKLRAKSTRLIWKDGLFP